jgi:hypothetical protein
MAVETGLEQVLQLDRHAVAVVEPDAGSFDLQECAAGFGNGMKGSREVAAVERIALGEFPECFLVAFQENDRILLQLNRRRRSPWP